MECAKRGLGFRAFKFREDSSEGYLVIALEADRETRRIALANIATGVGFKLNVKTVIGLIVGHNWPDSPACDVVIVDTSNMKVSENLIKMTDEIFGKLREAKR